MVQIGQIVKRLVRLSTMSFHLVLQTFAPLISLDSELPVDGCFNSVAHFTCDSLQTLDILPLVGGLAVAVVLLVFVHCLVFHIFSLKMLRILKIFYYFD